MSVLRASCGTSLFNVKPELKFLNEYNQFIVVYRKINIGDRNIMDNISKIKLVVSKGHNLQFTNFFLINLDKN